MINLYFATIKHVATLKKGIYAASMMIDLIALLRTQNWIFLCNADVSAKRKVDKNNHKQVMIKF